MNERIKQLRSALGMNQEDFGKLLGITKSGVSDIESGRRNVTEQHIIMLKNNNVSEEWLRTGEGDMFLPANRDSEIASFVKSLLNEEPDSFKNRFVSMLSKLTVEEWEFLERKAKELAGEDKKND